MNGFGRERDLMDEGCLKGFSIRRLGGWTDGERLVERSMNWDLMEGLWRRKLFERLR